MSSKHPVNIGQRIRFAREALHLSLEEACARLGLEQPAVLAELENGLREATAEQLTALSDTFGRDIQFFLDPFEVEVEAQYAWQAADDVPQEYLGQLHARTAGQLGLLSWLRSQSTEHGVPVSHSLPIGPESSLKDAEIQAKALSSTLGTQFIALDSLPSRVERKLGIPVLFVDMGEGLRKGSVSGVTCRLPQVTAIFLNRRDGEADRNFALARALFNALTWDRMLPGHRQACPLERGVRAAHVEKLAVSFAAKLLLPVPPPAYILDASRLYDVAYMADAAHKLHVPPAALAWRLFRDGATDERACSQLAASTYRTLGVSHPVPLSLSFVKDLHLALHRGRLSARKALKALGWGRADLEHLWKIYGLSDPTTSLCY